MYSSAINNDFFEVRILSSDFSDLGVKISFYDHIEEEFEEDDDKDWIEL